MDKKKIIIIDEDSESIARIKAAAEQLPVTLIAANPEKDVENLLLKSSPDLLILDSLLAQISSFQLCMNLRHHPLFKNLPILLLCPGYIPDHEYILEFLPNYDKKIHDGPTSFMPKPIPEEELRIRISELLELEKREDRKAKRARSILLIDDNLDNIELLKVRLETEGYVVKTAIDGASGLQAFREEKPVLIFLDIQMSGMNGIEVLKTIRKEDQDTAVIMMTAYGSEQMAVNAMKYGANDYLTKPLDHRSILGVIEETLKNNILQVKNRQLLSQLKESVKEMAKKYVILQETMKKLEEKQQELLKMQRLATITETAVSINHEINNPLCSILGNAELLIRELTGDGNEKLIKKLKIIEKESIRIQQTTRRLASLIDPILTDYASGIKMIDISRSRTEEDILAGKKLCSE